jgi:hypothetical protein
MKLHFKKLAIFLLMAVFVIGNIMVAPTVALAAATVTLYPQPNSTIAASNEYSINVNSNPSFTYQTFESSRVSGSIRNASWTDFAFSGGSVTVTVTKLGVQSINSVVIRPLNLGITATINGNTATFTISNPTKVSVEFDGDLNNRCFVFADAPEVNVPSSSDPSVLYYGPGVYNIGSNFAIPTGKDTVYIAGGAYIEGNFNTNTFGRNAITVRGRGVISGTGMAHQTFVSLVNFENQTVQAGYVANSIDVDGLTFVDSMGYASTSLNGELTSGSYNMNSPSNPNIINNLKMIAWGGQTDGLHFTGYTNVNDLFIQSGDDAIDTGNMPSGSKVTNLTIWKDFAGSAIMFSWNSWGATGNSIIDNVNIIHFDETDNSYGNDYVFMAYHGGPGNVSNYEISNVRVENFDGNVNSFLGLAIKKNAWCDPKGPYGTLSNIHFKNIQIDPPSAGNYITGYDATHEISNITFENLTIGGHVIRNLGEANIVANSFTSNIKFVTSNTAVDGGFEAQTTSTLSAPWSSTGSGAFGVDLYDGNYSTGRNNGWITSTTAAQWNEIHQLVTVSPNTTYKLSADIEGSSNIGNNFCLGIKKADGTNKQEVQFTPNSTSYSTVADTNTYTTGATETSLYIYGGYTSPSGSAWARLDNVYLLPQVTGGTLSASSATPGNVTLSTEGTVDWAHWGYSSGTSFDDKNGVNQISNVTVVGSTPAAQYTNNSNSYSWTGGYPTSSATNTTTGINVTGVNNGFMITVPADTTQRTLKVYTGVHKATGTVTAYLSDGSAADYTATIADSHGSTNQVITINYKAASAGQTLVFQIIDTAPGNGGNVTLQAATKLS